MMEMGWMAAIQCNFVSSKRLVPKITLLHQRRTNSDGFLLLAAQAVANKNAGVFD